MPQSFKSESGYYVLRLEQGVNRSSGAVMRIYRRISVGDRNVLEHKSRERLEMYLFKSDVAFESCGEPFHHLFRNIGLHLRQLYCKDPGEKYGSYGDKRQPDYFKRSFYGSADLDCPTCKNSKKYPIFSVFLHPEGSIKCAFDSPDEAVGLRLVLSLNQMIYVRDNFRNRVIMR